ncbi:hypothetical protein [Nocardia sp. N2S4-5]|uniref:hypothetical protein n=1 Tax=Nocardia sp. N2S4-5 TaxID=3351565 RepID=UPI0037D6E565
MTSRTRTPKPWLAGAIRIVAAVTALGSTVAVTALTVRDHDDQPVTVVVSQAPAPAARTAPAQPEPPAQPGSAPAAPAAPGTAPAGSVPPGTAPAGSLPPGTAPAGSVPNGVAPAASVPLGGAAGVAPGIAIGPGNAGPGASVPLNGGSQGPGGTDSVPLNGAPGAAGLFDAAPANAQPPCPLGWPAPRQQGGLASLIGLAPLAGPFSSEAFALGSVYQPLLQLVGPVLAEIAPVIIRNQPLIDPVIAQVQSVEAVVLEAILPYYGPYRDQLIAAEGDLARNLAPALDRIHDSEAASCFVAWQGQLIEQAKGGPVRVASLAHPGTTVELGPEH